MSMVCLGKLLAHWKTEGLEAGKSKNQKQKWKESVDRIQFSIISCQFFLGDFFFETSERPR